MSGLAPETITCEPPAERPTPLFANSKHPEIIVHVGANRNYSIGYLSYDAETQTLGGGLIALIAAGVGILLFVSFLMAQSIDRLTISNIIQIMLILLIVYRRSSSANKRQIKKLEQQIDHIEMKVAAECKG